MTKSEYKDFLDPKEFASLYLEWSNAGKPTGNNPLYISIWEGVRNAVKACIGSLQNRYHCGYQDYEDKVMDGVTTMITKLQNMKEVPENIVTMCYLPMLGICCGKKSIQQDFENGMASISHPTQGGDDFEDLLFIDDDASIRLGSWD